MGKLDTIKGLAMFQDMKLSEVECIIFLDIDGVLNSDKTTEKFPDTTYTPIDHVNVEFFRKLLSNIKNKYNVGIVLSSSWRFHFERKSASIFLLSHGIEAPFLDLTPKKLSSYDRGREIDEWISKNNYHDLFLILDDFSLKNDNFLWVDPKTGFQPHHIEKAEAILKKQEKEYQNG